MKPKTRTEKEVFRLSQTMPRMTEAQVEWMKKHASYDRACKYNGRKTDVEHYIIVTVRGGWQVLRHYYMYAVYKYRKLDSTFIHEVMQEWFKDGKYVFLSLPRNGLCYRVDAWCIGSRMEIRRSVTSRYYGFDPRRLGYDDVKYEVRQRKYQYIPKDDKCQYSIGMMYRALNTSPFNETLFKKYPEAWEWSMKNNFLFDHAKTTALKIAIRYGYDYNSIEWRDLVENLVYLGKDVHNPLLVCPAALKEAHEYWCQAAARKRRRISEKMANLRQIAQERAELQRMEQRARWEEQRKKEAEEAVPFYTKMRGKFFGLVIAENDLEISVLKSVQEFMEEGAAMHHCVFANAYYDVKKRPDCLILSAKVNGERAETIEVNLSDYSVVQCRGKHNSNTKYHDRILELMNRNMEKIRYINTHKARKRTPPKKAVS